MKIKNTKLQTLKIFMNSINLLLFHLCHQESKKKKKLTRYAPDGVVYLLSLYVWIGME